MNDRISLEKIIREKLKENGSNISKLVEATGITRTRVYKIFADNNTDISSLYQICDFLEISISDIFPNNDSKLKSRSRYLEKLAMRNAESLMLLFYYELIPSFLKYKEKIKEEPKLQGGFHNEDLEVYKILGIRNPDWDENTSEMIKVTFLMDLNNVAIKKLEEIAPQLVSIFLLGSKNWPEIPMNDYPLFVQFIIDFALRLPENYEEIMNFDFLT